MAQAKAYVAEHLPELARDIVEWRQTSLLRDDSRVRLLAAMFEPIMDHGRLQLAESLVSSAALQEVASSSP
jgi:hypothetical protein